MTENGNENLVQENADPDLDYIWYKASATPESDIEDIIMPNILPLEGQSQGGSTIALAVRAPERLKEPRS